MLMYVFGGAKFDRHMEPGMQERKSSSLMLQVNFVTTQCDKRALEIRPQRQQVQHFFTGFQKYDYGRCASALDLRSY